MESELALFVEKYIAEATSADQRALKKAEAEAAFYKFKFEQEKQRADMERKLRRQCESTLELMRERDLQRRGNTIQMLLVRQAMEFELNKFVQYHGDNNESYFSDRPLCQTFRTKVRSASDRRKVSKEDILEHWTACHHIHLSERHIFDTVLHSKQDPVIKSKNAVKEIIPKLHSRLQAVSQQVALKEEKTIVIPSSVLSEVETLALATFFQRHHYICTTQEGCEIKNSSDK